MTIYKIKPKEKSLGSEDIKEKEIEYNEKTKKLLKKIGYVKNIKYKFNEDGSIKSYTYKRRPVKQKNN